MEISEQAYRNLQRHIARLCFLIVASDCPDSEIDIERLHLRVQAASLFPEKIPLNDMIYESRFRRLREQFRCSSDLASRPHISRYGAAKTFQVVQPRPHPNILSCAETTG